MLYNFLTCLSTVANSLPDPPFIEGGWSAAEFVVGDLSVEI
jgi:hypothetical protein